MRIKEITRRKDCNHWETQQQSQILEILKCYFLYLVEEPRDSLANLFSSIVKHTMGNNFQLDLQAIQIISCKTILEKIKRQYLLYLDYLNGGLWVANRGIFADVMFYIHKVKIHLIN